MSPLLLLRWWLLLAWRRRGWCCCCGERIQGRRCLQRELFGPSLVLGSSGILGRFVSLRGFSSGRRDGCEDDFAFHISDVSAGDGCSRFVYQLSAKLGWWFAFPPGSDFVRSDGVLADLVASGLCPSGEAMAGGHLQRPEHSAVSRYMPMQSTCYSWCQLKIMFRREGDRLQAAEGCSDRRRRA